MNSRREFLGWLAASAASAAQVASLERRGPQQHVIVLGAGLAGLCSAYELTNQGHRVTLLEAQSRPGGRVRTLREGFAPGLYGEAGPESVPGSHDLTLHYARSFGLNLLPFRIAGTRSIYHIRGRRIFPSAADTVWPFELTREERRLGSAGLQRKYTEAEVQRAVDAGFPKQLGHVMARWDGHTPGAWFRSQGASSGAAELLSFGFGAGFGSAASFLLHGLNSRGSTSYFRIEGGNDHLPDAFSKKLEIRYGTPVLAVTQDDRSVRVSLRAAGGTETLTADRAICTLPCPVIGKIFNDARLSAAKQRAIREQNYSRTVKVFLQSRTRFWLKDNLSGSATTDLPIERLSPDPGTESSERGALAAYPIGPYGKLRMSRVGRQFLRAEGAPRWLIKS